MKKILNCLMMLILMIFVALPSLAEEKAPAPFEDSSIQRTLKNGKIQKFDGDQYMIVKRGKKAKPPVPVVVTKTVTKKIYLKRKAKKNSLMLHIGYAPDGLEVHGRTVEEDRRPVLGLSYSRDINDRFRLQGQILTNSSIIGGIGFNY